VHRKQKWEESLGFLDLVYRWEHLAIMPLCEALVYSLIVPVAQTNKWS
jgi:hypothetical protein